MENNKEAPPPTLEQENISNLSSPQPVHPISSVTRLSPGDIPHSFVE